MVTSGRQGLFLQEGDALVVVDVQNCFLPGGSLAVPNGDRIIEPLNQITDRFARKSLPIFFSRDWHPSNHCSFQSQGGPWPRHGVQDTEDAEFPPDLKIPVEAIIISKGMDKNKEEYSAFSGKDELGCSLEEHLRSSGIKRVFVGGLATDYCVLSTVLDILQGGYEVYVLADCVRAVDVKPGDGDRALAEMRGKGAHIINSTDIED
ncbi:MAG: nicotinamidase [Syntrophales bacterium]|nr:nicotinamidase [Syntrophales bacterium]